MIITKEKYQDFLNGNCSPLEEARIATHLQQHPGLLYELLGLEDWLSFEPGSNTTEIPATTLHENLFSPVAGRTVKLRRTTKISALAVAACISGLIIIAPVIYFQTQPLTTSPVRGIAKTETSALIYADSNQLNHADCNELIHADCNELIHADFNQLNHATSDQLVELVNKSTETLTTYLPDGSLVHLQNGSRLIYSHQQSRTERRVKLVGTAYFSVRKDSTRPFRVHTANTITTALGTAFTISEMQGNNSILIKLHEGKIVVQTIATSFNNKDSSIFMSPGENLSVDQSGSMEISRGRSEKLRKGPQHQATPLEQFNSSDTIRFNKTLVPEVFQQLAQIYKAEIWFDTGELNNFSITASFARNESLHSIIDIICSLNDLRFEIVSNGFKIQKN